MFYAAVFEEGAPRPIRAYGPPVADARAATVCATSAKPCVTTAARTSAAELAHTSEYGGVGESAECH